MPFIASTNQLGAPDLDVRPPPMLRDTIDCWIQDCPACGYVASDISADEDDIDAVLAAEAYRALAGVAGDGAPRLISAFRRRAMIDDARGNADGAGNRLLQAAWVADDSGAATTAIACRREAAERMNAHLRTGGVPVEYRLRLVDVLRRARLFDEAMAEAEAVRAAVPAEGMLAAIARFQNKLITAADTGRHTVDEIHQGEAKPR
jgi:hypothetical protein